MLRGDQVDRVRGAVEETAWRELRVSGRRYLRESVGGEERAGRHVRRPTIARVEIEHCLELVSRGRRIRPGEHAHRVPPVLAVDPSQDLLHYGSGRGRRVEKRREELRRLA